MRFRRALRDALEPAPGRTNAFMLAAAALFFASSPLLPIAECDAAIAREQKRIFVVHSYPPNSWTDGLDRGLASGLEKAAFKTYHFHAKYWWKQPPEMQAQERAKIMALAAAFQPSLVVLCDDEAADFLAEPFTRAKTPTFVTGVNRMVEKTKWSALAARGEVAGTLEAYPVERTVSILKTLAPSRRSFSILTSDSDTSRWTIEMIRSTKSDEILKRANLKLRQVYVLGEWEAWKKAVDEINREDDLVWILIPFGVHDSNNQEVSPARMIAWLRPHLKAAAIGPRSLAPGLLLAVGIDAHKLAAETAQAIRRYFGGASVADLGLRDAVSYEILANNRPMAESDRVRLPARAAAAEAGR